MRKSIVKITYLSILLILVATLSLCAVDIGVAQGSSSEAVAADSTSTPSNVTYIHFYEVSTRNVNGFLWPDSATGKVQLSVSVSNPDDTVTLTITTRNKSAIADVDYVANSQTYTLTKASGTQYFTVQTINTSAPNIVENGLSSEKGTTRTFEVVVCSISSKLGNECVVTNDPYSKDNSEYKEGSESFECRVATRYDYVYTQQDDGAYFDDYFYGNSFASAWFEGNVNAKDKIYYQAPSGNKEVWVDNNESYDFSMTFDRLVGYDYILKYMKTGWADVYYGGSAVLYESGWSTVDTRATLTLKEARDDGEGTIYYSADYWDPKSSGAPILFGVDAYAHGGNDSYRYYIEENSAITGYTVYNTNDPMYSRVASYGFSSVGGKVYKGNGESVTLHVTRDSTWKMVFSALRIDSELYDTAAPTVQGTYLDNLSNTTDNKVLRLSVRFSEPVHFASNVNTSAVKITGYKKGDATKPISFAYAGGSGTDTLYFDCNLEEYENKYASIESIKFTKGSFKDVLGGKVCDYAYNFALSNNIVDSDSFGDVAFDNLNIDMRTPDVSVTNTSSATSKSHTATVTVTNMDASGAKLYYTWVEASKVTDPDKYVPQSYLYCNTTSPTKYTVTGENFDGEYYLYVKAQSAYGKEGFAHSAKLSFDNTPIFFESVDGGNSNAALSERSFKIAVNGNAADLDTLTMGYRQSDNTEWKWLTLSPSFVYHEIEDTADWTYTVKAKDTLGMGDNKSQRFYFKFVTKDKAGNEAMFETIDSLLFDTCDRCKLSLTIRGTSYAVSESAEAPSTIIGSGNSYQNTYKADGFTLSFDGGATADNLQLASLKIGSDDVTASASYYFDIEQGSDTSKLTLTYKRKSGDTFVGGYYTIQIKSSDKTSDVYTFYLMGDSDDVAGYKALEDNKLVANKVWMLSGVDYYYWSSSTTIGKITQYNTQNNPLVFSSYDTAKNYVEFMEWQDLSLVQLTDAYATAINNNQSEYYRKAKDETATAKAGQTWIRYKATDWSPTSDRASDMKYWNLYFYSETTVTSIDTDLISSNLSKAMDSVVSSIMTNGSYVYLVGNDWLDGRNAPTIDSSRVRASVITVEKTKTNVEFATASGVTKPISYSGDEYIYNSQYTDSDGKTYPFAVQKCNVSDYTSIYYKAHDKDEYTKVSLSGNYYYLKDLIKGTGIYDIVERDEKGVREYSVFIDNSSPDFKVAYKTINGESVETIRNGSIKTLNVKEFTFKALVDDDECAYVAVYTLDEKLKFVKHASEIKDGDTLEDGKYLIYLYDRSGNGYSFTLRVCSRDLANACTVTESPNEKITFTYTEDRDEIYRFEIYLDNVLIANDISQLKQNKLTFYAGGVYRFYVEDLYGNVFDKTVELTRKAPELDWYVEEDGQFVKVNDGDLGLIKTRLSESEFLITSKGRVNFRFPIGNIGYEYVGTQKPQQSTVSGHTSVIINQTDNWQFKVYYTNYPSLYTIYSGKSDTSAPTISATTNRPSYTFADEDESAIATYFENHTNVKEGDVINLPSVSVAQTTVTTQTVASGELVLGGTVTVRVSDLSGLYKWSYTYNGETTEYTSNFPDKVMFGKEGAYSIVATDKLGNTSSFSFSIGRTECTEISVDNLEGVTSEVGNNNVIATLEGAGSFAFVLDGEYFKLSTDGSNLVRTILKVGKKNEEGKFTAVQYKETLGQLTSTPKTIAENTSRTLNAYLKDGVVYLKVALKERVKDEVHKTSVQLRVQSDLVADIKYTNTTLSDERAYLDCEYTDKDGVATSCSLETTLYTNKEFKVSLPDGATTFTVYYSADGSDFKILDFYDKNDGAQTFGNQGYYEFEVYNTYGNPSTVRVVVCDGIAASGAVTYKDGTVVRYGIDFGGKFYSNYSFSLTFGKDIVCTVTKDGKAFDGYDKKTEKDNSAITVSAQGVYVFTLNDAYGNVVSKEVEIKEQSLEFSDKWLGGFNDKALRKSEGYTNGKVFFDIDNLTSGNVKFVSVTFGDATSVVYDKTPSKDINNLKNYLVGDDGDGKYTIVFRDIYGNRADKEIHYQSASPLSVSRTTRSMEKTSYEITDDVLESGIWSNKTISLSTTAAVSNFLVNGQRRDLPFSVDFESESGSGKLEYEIEYLDEFGFEYKFTCVLYRANVEIDSSGMSVKDGVTRDPVAIAFDENNTATITINGVDKGEYKSGTHYSVDGNYVISVFDKAGNVARYSIKRDSVAEFCFYTGNLEKRLVSGEITNESAVSFAPLNNDSVSYYTVYRDGKEIENYDSKTFTESGKWEIVLFDDAGNKDYFCFYIVTHAYVSFEYNTPSGYKITQMTCDTGGGKIDWIDAVDDIGDHSHVLFDESGKYEVVMTSEITGKTSGFSITIDKSVPEITLDGVQNGGITKTDVKISGYKAGDTVYVYRDGTLVKEVKATSSSDISDITEKGKYKVVVVSESGARSEVEFERVYTANIATSALIIAAVLVVVIGLFVGLLFRKRSRIE